MYCYQGWEFAHLHIAHSLICSFCSNQMSKCLRFAQIAQDKWAMWANISGGSPKLSDLSKSLRSFTINEQPWAIRLGRSPKMSDHELIAQVAHLKCANERNRSFFWANHSFAYFWAKNERFAQKIDERIPSPGFFPPSLYRVCFFRHSLYRVCFFLPLYIGFIFYSIGFVFPTSLYRVCFCLHLSFYRLCFFFNSLFKDSILTLTRYYRLYIFYDSLFTDSVSSVTLCNWIFCFKF